MNKNTTQADTLPELLEKVRSTLNYSELGKLARARQRLASAGTQQLDALTPVRVAIAGNATTKYLTPLIELFLESYGVDATIHEVPFGSTESELLLENSALAEFSPQLLIIVQSPLAIMDWPADTAGTDEAETFAASRVAHIYSLCRKAHDRFGCELVIDNWHLLPGRPHGSWSRQMPAERNSIIRRMNLLLDRESSPWLHIHDVDGMASLHGLQNWIDWRFWYHAKQPIGFAAVGAYASSVASTAAAIYRAPVKCVVLDLDNTLWGGVIGDDGLSGIKVGQGDAQSEAFQAFQCYLLRLKQRGLLLAVASKNELANAQSPFEELPEMILRLDDFVAFKANWEPKPGNIQAIANELNIGLDALVFVDDNPVERAHVRSTLPMVRVIEIPDDPAGFPAALDASGWFAMSGLSGEDLERTSQYQANALRDELSASIDDYESYLQSLEQISDVSAFEPAQLDRITQLVNKTNQFNLTTQRVTRSEIEELANRDDVLTSMARLSDRFGDNGIIAVIYGSVDDDRLHINQWLMSCRVFNRGVEQMLMNHIVMLARDRGVREILGEYRPTAKNELVRDLYPRLGFRSSEAPDGAAEDAVFWSLEVTSYRDHAHTIKPSQENNDG